MNNGYVFIYSVCGHRQPGDRRGYFEFRFRRFGQQSSFRYQSHSSGMFIHQRVSLLIKLLVSFLHSNVPLGLRKAACNTTRDFQAASRRSISRTRAKLICRIRSIRFACAKKKDFAASDIPLAPMRRTRRLWTRWARAR